MSELDNLKHKKPDEKASQKPCEKCGQVDMGQTGEYACPECGLPTTWDTAHPAPAESKPAMKAVEKP
jgi:uncharacterized Zn finger protein (UPF0148 family)